MRRRYRQLRERLLKSPASLYPSKAGDQDTAGVCRCLHSFHYCLTRRDKLCFLFSCVFYLVATLKVWNIFSGLFKWLIRFTKLIHTGLGSQVTVLIWNCDSKADCFGSETSFALGNGKGLSASRTELRWALGFCLSEEEICTALQPFWISY